MVFFFFPNLVDANILHQATHVLEQAGIPHSWRNTDLQWDVPLAQLLLEPESFIGALKCKYAEGEKINPCVMFKA